jgi:peptidoglycan/xylan/chitin deacetylase (PgdA/CDA1 family)
MNRELYQLTLGSLGVFSRVLSIRKPTIFCFHSVAGVKASLDAQGAMAVSTPYLERLVLDLRGQNVPIVSLAEAVTRIANQDSDPFVVLTFDDGYRDNYENLFPLMVRLHVPFTLFVTTGLIDQTLPMWWDVLERMALAGEWPVSGKLPEPEASASLGAMTQQFRALDAHGQRGLWAELARTSSRFTEKDAYERSLTWPMLREMSASGLLTVGCHTRHHPMLSRLSREEVRSEFADARQRLEQELDIAVNYVAYPYGQPWEVGPHAADVARELGFKAAFSTIARPLAKSDHREMFNLPRILLSNKAQTSNIALGYMSGLPAALKRMVKPDHAALR